jgi:hypothetical protein
MVVWVWVMRVFLASEVERESGENDLKSSTCAVKKKLHSAVQNGTVQVFFFFFKKRKKIRSYPKIGYDKFNSLTICFLGINL